MDLDAKSQKVAARFYQMSLRFVCPTFIRFGRIVLSDCVWWAKLSQPGIWLKQDFRRTNCVPNEIGQLLLDANRSLGGAAGSSSPKSKVPKRIAAFPGVPQVLVAAAIAAAATRLR